MDSLIVYLNDVPVGRLTDDEGRLSFTYDQAYADDARNEPLSHVIPLSNPTFHVREQNPSGCWGFALRSSLHSRFGRVGSFA